MSFAVEWLPLPKLLANATLFRLKNQMKYLKDEYQPPMIELLRVSVQSVLVEFSVPSEEKVEVEGYEFDDDF